MKLIKINVTQKTKHSKLNLSAQVDDEDYIHLSKINWHISIRKNCNYARTAILNQFGKQVTLLMHREIMLMNDILKSSDPKIFIDHIDGNGLNNQKSNLRICTQFENMQNKKAHKDSASKYKGVFFEKSSGRWRAGIGFNYKYKHLGRFKTEEEAALAYNKKALELFGNFARINII